MQRPEGQARTRPAAAVGHCPCQREAGHLCPMARPGPPTGPFRTLPTLHSRLGFCLRPKQGFPWLLETEAWSQLTLKGGGLVCEERRGTGRTLGGRGAGPLSGHGLGFSSAGAEGTGGQRPARPDVGVKGKHVFQQTETWTRTSRLSFTSKMACNCNFCP